MRVISRTALRNFWQKHPDAEQPRRTWYADVKHSTWKKPSDIKLRYRSASFLQNNRVIFNIKGNNYRIVVVVQYKHGVVYIRFVGTHAEYDRIDASTI